MSKISDGRGAGEAGVTRREVLGWSQGLAGAGLLMSTAAFGAAGKDAKAGAKEGGGNPVTAGKDLVAFPPIETHLIRSKHVRQTFKIQVMRPGRKRGSTTRYPVVYATDGNWTFDMFKSLAYLLQLTDRDAPPFILVGICYPSDFAHAGMQLRVRDFTAPPYPRWGDNWSEWLKKHYDSGYEGVLLPEPGSKDFHGGEDFRNFIGEELIPFIDAKYETLPGERTYFGHSGGGFFGMYTMLTRPQTFKNYIVSSPGVIYHGEGPGGVRLDNNEFGLQMVRDFAASGKSLDGIKLYLSAGAEEESEPAVANWRLTSSLERLAKVFKDAAIPGLTLMSEIFPGESHITVWPIAFCHGVQAMLGTRRVYRALYF